MDQTVVKLEKVNKYYDMGKAEPLHVVKDMDLEIKKGEMVAIMGPSGSGKSTLLNLIGILDVPSTGQIYIDGEHINSLPIRKLPKIRREKIGFIFQTFNLLPKLNILENVQVPMVYNRINRRRRMEISLRVLKQVNLDHRIKHRPSELSGGERQRVAIARALVNNPSIILADEPTGNLDQASGTEIMEILKKLNEENQVTVILVTHEPHIAEYANRTIKIIDGKIVT